jgi:hypothetical protein
MRNWSQRNLDGKTFTNPKPLSHIESLDMDIIVPTMFKRKTLIPIAFSLEISNIYTLNTRRQI